VILRPFARIVPRPNYLGGFFPRLGGPAKFFGLYGAKPASRLNVTDLVVAFLLHRFAITLGEGGYLPRGLPTSVKAGKPITSGCCA
jgi:hypothetical protein